MLSLAVLNKIQLFFFLLSSFLEKILKFQIMSFNFEDRHFFFRQIVRCRFFFFLFYVFTSENLLTTEQRNAVLLS